MSNVQSSRDRRLKRVARMREMLDYISGLDAETVFSGMGPKTRERIPQNRLLPRAAVSRARKYAGSRFLDDVNDDRDAFLFGGGSATIERLSVSAGIRTLWKDMLRVVRRSELDALDAATGVPNREIALRGRAGASDVAPFFDCDEFPDLSDRIRREGALAWGCWLASRDRTAARRLRIFTPDTIVSLLPHSLPESAVIRAQRQSIVETELAVMMAEASSDNSALEVA